MKRVLIRRSISVLCSLALVVTLTAAGAAAQTACGVVWDEASGTVSLTRGETPYYCDRGTGPLTAAV